MKRVLTSATLAVALALAAYIALDSSPQGTSDASPSTHDASTPPAGISPPPAPALLAAKALNRNTAGTTDKADDIGSEGYGPHIQRIADAGDVQQALKAVHWIDTCRSNNEQVVEGLYQARANLPQAQEAGLNAVIERTQAEMRRCQTVTPDVARLQRPLALLALQAKVYGAAAEYARLTDGSPPPEQMALMTTQLESDARAGSLMSLRALVLRNGQFGLDAETAATYYAAYKIVEDAPEPRVGLGGIWPQVSPPARPVAADASAARAIADRVLAQQEQLARQLPSP